MLSEMAAFAHHVYHTNILHVQVLLVPSRQLTAADAYKVLFSLLSSYV